MPYKDQDKQRKANKEAQYRYRSRRRQREGPLTLDGCQFTVAQARLVLGVEGRLSKESVNSALRNMSKTVHPDTNPGPESGRLMGLAAGAAKTLRYWAQRHQRAIERTMRGQRGL